MTRGRLLFFSCCETETCRCKAKASSLRSSKGFSRPVGERLGLCLGLIALLQACASEETGDAPSPGATESAGASDGQSDNAPDVTTSATTDVTSATTANTAPTSAVTDSVPNPGQAGSLSERYPGDVGMAEDPAVLFFDDFETGWGRWDYPDADTDYLHLETGAEQAHAGERYLRSSVTAADLEREEYISSQTRVELTPRTAEFYARFYVQFVGTAPPPHHWVRTTAGTPAFSGSGLANTVPPGDEGFWFDFDVTTSDVFNFYVYWYKMRSGRCNDGSAEPGCAGDQGTTYYYGNVFEPPQQTPFTRDEWFCVELRSRANTVGASDGELQFWVDDVSVGEYRPGQPNGTWLRASFHTDGCEFSACTEPQPFEGFDFRATDDVLFKTFQLDAYYERQSSADKRAELTERGIVVDDAQTILYDDVVVATRRIGCRR